MRKAVFDVCAARGRLKILEKCAYPLTAKGKVNLIVSEKAVIEVTAEGLLLKVAADTTVDEVVKLTGAELTVAGDCRVAEDF